MASLPEGYKGDWKFPLPSEVLAKPRTYTAVSRCIIDAPWLATGSVTSTGPFHRVMDAIEHLQDEARKMGGNALIELSEGPPKGLEMSIGG